MKDFKGIYPRKAVELPAIAGKQHFVGHLVETEEPWLDREKAQQVLDMINAELYGQNEKGHNR